MLSADHHRVSIDLQLAPMSLYVDEGEGEGEWGGLLFGGEDGGRLLNEEERQSRQTAKAELLSRSVFLPHSVRLLFPPKTPALCCLTLSSAEL